MTEIATHRSAPVMAEFHRFSDIFGLWKTGAAAARDLGMKPGTLRKCGERNNFPPEKLALLVEKASLRPGGDDVTYETVCRIYAGDGERPEGPEGTAR